MVPGMTERERLAADMVRLEWLADAVHRPPLSLAWSAVPFGPRRFVPLGVRRRGLTTALALGQRVRLFRLKLVWPPLERGRPQDGLTG